MKELKTLATFALVLSLLYLLDGAYITWQLVNLRKTFAYYGIPGDTELGVFTVATLFRVYIIAGSSFLACGLAALISATGMFKLKEWAREGWLIITLLLLVIDIVWMACLYLAGDRPEVLIIQFLPGALAYVLTVISWIALTQGPLKSNFSARRN